MTKMSTHTHTEATLYHTVRKPKKKLLVLHRKLGANLEQGKKRIARRAFARAVCNRAEIARGRGVRGERYCRKTRSSDLLTLASHRPSVAHSRIRRTVPKNPKSRGRRLSCEVRSVALSSHMRLGGTAVTFRHGYLQAWAPDLALPQLPALLSSGVGRYRPGSRFHKRSVNKRAGYVGTTHRLS